MEGIEHKMVNVNGIKMHVAEKGKGPAVLMIHGFPELWYSYRHQILSLSASGYRAIAPDLRGYGDTDAPPSFRSYTSLHIVGDLIALIDALAIDKVFLVGHDWGAFLAWQMCLYRPDRVIAYASLGLPFLRRMAPIEGLRAFYGDDYYICRFQEPGVMEAEFAQAGASKVIKRFVTTCDKGPIMLPRETWLNEPIASSCWMPEEDVNYCATKFEKSGFTGALNYYRAYDLTWELTAVWAGAQVKVPAKLIIGDLDGVYTMPGMKDYIHGDDFKKDVPLLEEVVVMEGMGHFIQQTNPEEINEQIIGFIKKFV